MGQPPGAENIPLLAHWVETRVQKLFALSKNRPQLVFLGGHPAFAPLLLAAINVVETIQFCANLPPQLATKTWQPAVVTS